MPTVRRRAKAKRKKRTPRKHGVKVHLQVFELSKAGTSLDLEVTAHGQKLGDLTIGRGSITWHGVNRKSSKRIGWSRFAEIMDEMAYGS